MDKLIFHALFLCVIKPGAAKAKAVYNIYKDYIKQEEILLVQPEHILLFKLIGIKRVYSREEEESRLLL